MVGCQTLSPSTVQEPHAQPSARADIEGDSNTVQQELQAINQTVLSQNDTWAVRLMAVGVVMLGLSYPVGKWLWLFGAWTGKIVRNGNGSTTSMGCRKRDSGKAV